MGCSNFVGIAGIAASSFLSKSSLGMRDNSTAGNWYSNYSVKSKATYSMSSNYKGGRHTWCNNCACYGQFSQGANLSNTSNYTNSVNWKLDSYGNVFIYNDQQGSFDKNDSTYYRGEDGCDDPYVTVEDATNGDTTCTTELSYKGGAWSANYKCSQKCTSTHTQNNPTWVPAGDPYEFPPNGSMEDRPTTETNNNVCTPYPETTTFYRLGGTYTNTDTTTEFLYNEVRDEDNAENDLCFFYWGEGFCGNTYKSTDRVEGKSTLTGKVSDSTAQGVRLASLNFRLENIYRTNQPQSATGWRCGYSAAPDACWSFWPEDGYIDGVLMANPEEGWSSSVILVPYVNPNSLKDVVVNGEAITEFKAKVYFYAAPFSYDEYGEVYLGDGISQCNCGNESNNGLLPALEMTLSGALDGPKNKEGFGDGDTAAGTYVVGGEGRVDSSMFQKPTLVFYCSKDITLDNPS